MTGAEGPPGGGSSSFAGRGAEGPLIDPSCLSCGTAGKPGATFCVACGVPIVGVAPAPGRPLLAEGWRDFRVSLGLFTTLLAVQVVCGLVYFVGKQQLPVLVLGTIGFAIATAVAAIARRDLVVPALRRPGLPAWGYLAIVLASPLIVVAVATYVRVLARTFGLQVPDELEGLEGHGFPLAILLIAVLPPLTEELAFRGVILGALGRQLRPAEALVLSSFAFAILHLSVPSLITHLPLGLYFGWLAVRSGSLWPGMLAHACHNLGVIIAERAGWFA